MGFTPELDMVGLADCRGFKPEPDIVGEPSFHQIAGMLHLSPTSCENHSFIRTKQILASFTGFAHKPDIVGELFFHQIENHSFLRLRTILSSNCRDFAHEPDILGEPFFHQILGVLHLNLTSQENHSFIRLDFAHEPEIVGEPFFHHIAGVLHLSPTSKEHHCFIRFVRISTAIVTSCRCCRLCNSRHTQFHFGCRVNRAFSLRLLFVLPIIIR
ncbi:uncharacterized protein [Atheta coriaria]|uniref:uncharacterized protein isoform X1 n=1 Tax=Dalotia coriaria TaxID=877792 RepID=UPI0031F3736C